jgi:hypothetical protein
MVCRSHSITLTYCIGIVIIEWKCDWPTHHIEYNTHSGLQWHETNKGN